MKLHIVQPTHYTDRVSRRLFRIDKLSVSPLTLPYLAALVPDGVDLTLMDERTGGLDTSVRCDCVFMTLWTLNSIRAYELADDYRNRGIKVVMGGPHCYFHADEALRHADAVAIGEGENLIPVIISDLSAGRLKKEYRTDQPHDLVGLPLPRRDLVRSDNIKRFHAVAVQTSRGCPNSCEFCSERMYLGPRYRMRPVDEVIEEVRAVKSKQILFVDSTLAGSRSRTMQLMEKLIPFKLRWSALWTADRALDREFMELAKRSGLLHINIGIESIKQETLDGLNKRTTTASKLTDMIRTLRDMDISFSFNLIFGSDTDTKDDFGSTLRFLMDNKVHAAFFNTLAPHKGTRMYDDLLAQGRLIDPDNINRWPGLAAEIIPKNYSAADLEDGIRDMYKKFYSWRSILRRLPLPLSEAAIASWVVNISQRKMTKGNIEDFDDF
jgi:radical SAM superfamily enzyme YgiQ (UPF0313 family)